MTQGRRVQGKGPQLQGTHRRRLFRYLVRSLQGHRPQGRGIQPQIPAGQVLPDRRRPAGRDGC